MGAAIATAGDIRQNDFLNRLRSPDEAGVQHLQWSTGLASLPQLHPSAVVDASVSAALSEAAGDIAALSEGTPRLGEAIRHVLIAVTDSKSHNELCGRLVLLRYFLLAAQTRAAGCGVTLQRLCTVPGGEGRRSHAGLLALDTLVELLLREGEGDNDTVGGLSARCELIAVLQVCCSGSLYVPVSTQQHGGVAVEALGGQA
eukprot:Hpha_TRINITY_DN22692_c0_g1::TRINITY_DN22692_c0_g1_i1::g.192623::m.192623